MLLSQVKRILFYIAKTKVETKMCRLFSSRVWRLQCDNLALIGSLGSFATAEHLHSWCTHQRLSFMCDSIIVSDISTKLQSSIFKWDHLTMFLCPIATAYGCANWELQSTTVVCNMTNTVLLIYWAKQVGGRVRLLVIIVATGGWRKGLTVHSLLALQLLNKLLCSFVTFPNCCPLSVFW